MSSLVAAQVRTDVRARAAYAEGAGIYRILPRAVATPARIEDLPRLLAWARESGMTIIPRGAGSAMAGGNVGDGLIVDLCGVNDRRVRIDPERRIAEAAPGATGAAINRAARRFGLRFGPNPSSLAFATSGGLVSTNASGSRSFRCGSVRRWVQGVDLLTSDGELLQLDRGSPADSGVSAVRRFNAHAASGIKAYAHLIRDRFPRTRKNSSGYALDAWLASGDLVDLVIGSEGTLGIITGVRWRLEPIPPARGGLRVAVLNDGELMYALELLRGMGCTAIELLDQTFLRFVAHSLSEASRHLALRAGAIVLAEFEGTPEQVHTALRSARGRLGTHVYEATASYGEAALEALWAIRHAASPLLARLGATRRSLQVIEDGCVPVERLTRYLMALRSIPDRHGVETVVFGHAGDGHLHVNLLPDTTRSGWESTLRTIFDEISAVQLSLNGTPSGEHGDGRLRAPLVERLYGDRILALFEGVKSDFDPDGLLNPGVILPQDDPGSHPVSRLKAGDGAVELPADIARALLDIERSGSWETERLVIADRIPDSTAD
jgi:FAD/FMN-containing dehydrogenase